MKNSNVETAAKYGEVEVFFEDNIFEATLLRVLHEIDHGHFAFFVFYFATVSFYIGFIKFRQNIKKFNIEIVRELLIFNGFKV